jgi:hypothetical protein
MTFAVSLVTNGVIRVIMISVPSYAHSQAIVQRCSNPFSIRDHLNRNDRQSICTQFEISIAKFMDANWLEFDRINQSV